MTHTCPTCKGTGQESDPSRTEVFENLLRTLQHVVYRLAHARIDGAEISPKARALMITNAAGIEALLSDEFANYGEYLEARKARERE